MYIVGQAYDPESSDCWTLDIHNVHEDDRLSHWACIQIHDDTLDGCLIKANAICDTLNSEKITGQMTSIKDLTVSRKQWRRNAE